MTRHYETFRLDDPAVIPGIVARWPFATIVANGPDWPLSAQSPLVMVAGQLAVEFHLAKANAALPVMQPGAKVMAILQGPSAHVSPSWYRGRFPLPESDRSRTAPTWDYLTLTLRGRLEILADDGLASHLADLVAQHEAADGWRLSEIDPQFFSQLRTHIRGFRLRIEGFDCVAKYSQDKGDQDIPGVIAGLTARGQGQDLEVAKLVQNPGSLLAQGSGITLASCRDS